MLRAAIVGVVIAACGRIDFDARAADGGAPDIDAALDAPAGLTMRLTFGDRTGADITGVTADNSLIDDDFSHNCGGCSSIYSGPGEVGLLRFDLEAAGEVTVVSAAVEVFLTAVPAVNDGAVDVYAIREAWDEGANPNQEPGISNWEFRQPGVTWAEPGAIGASRGAAPLATFTVDTTETPSRIELPVELVQGWLDNPASNLGIGFYGRNYTGDGADHPHFFSSESPESSLRPLLDLEVR